MKSRKKKKNNKPNLLKKIRGTPMGDESWANYSDLLEVDKKVLGDAIEASYVVCYDAANLVFSLHSSTSGMYAKWHVNVSPSCTVYLDRMIKYRPIGVGGHFNDALRDFTKNCNEIKVKVEAEEKERKAKKDDQSKTNDK